MSDQNSTNGSAILHQDSQGPPAMEPYRHLTERARAELHARASVHQDDPEKTRRAVELVEQGRVERTGPDSWEVIGSQGTIYTLVAGKCSCKARSTPGTPWACYHRLAVAFSGWVEKALQEEGHPMFVDETEQHMPVQASQEGQESVNGVEDVSQDPEINLDHPDANKTLPQAQAIVPALWEVSHEPLAATALAHSLQEWGRQRDIITQFLRERLVRDVDYGRIHFVNKEKCKDGPARCKTDWHWSKETLFKPGAEKFLGLFRLTPTFRKDTDVWEMLGSPAGTICLVCTLRTASGDILGEGRGARDIKQDYGDINKTIKMVQKSASIDAVLRTGALSDVFTQDLEDSIERADDGAMIPDMTQGRAGRKTVQELRAEVETLAEQQHRSVEYVWGEAERKFGLARAYLSIEHLERMVKVLTEKGAA